ncbi:MAG: flagellar biosynthetic protein FliQ [Spirochaetes bacterium]|nr:MAG: flagellar biosynthetic protein FliQ [Spirochaetota bacterium]
MDLGSLILLMRSAIITIITVASPVLIVAMGVGLIVSIFQATTSIQDQTLTFVPKILAILGVLAALFGWMVTKLTSFTILLFERIPDLAK